MNDTELQAAQILRERNQNSQQFKKWKDELDLQQKKSDGSNIPIAGQWKKAVLDRIVHNTQKEIEDPEWNRNSEATLAIKRCLNISLTHKIDRKTKEKIVEAAPVQNYFELDVAVFITLQMMLDNAMRPEFSTTINDKGTGKERVCHPKIDQDALFRNVGERVELEVSFNFVNACFPNYFRALDKSCKTNSNTNVKASSANWRFNMKRAMKKKAEALRAAGDYETAEQFEWKPFGSDARHIGAWLVTRCIKYAQVQFRGGEPYDLFQVVKRQITPRKKKSFVTLTEQAFADKQAFAEKHREWIKTDQPMLCPPVSADGDHYGHWLLAENLSHPAEHKGELRISTLMVDYINRLQSVPYKINPFVLAVMDQLAESNQGLGKFQPHRYEEPATVSQSLGLSGDYETNTEAIYTMDKEVVRQARHKRAVEIEEQLNKVNAGRQSKVILESAKDLSQYDRFYYPYQWDFRGRAYCRCMTSPQPQGTDYSKAAIKFADEQPLDSQSKRYLSIELANNAGKDKVSFGERVEWVTNNLSKICLVATMLQPEGDFSQAISFLKTLPEPWQFLAAADEYYHCFIAKDRQTTSLRCGVDMSCSAAGIHAGWKRDRASAELVNVTPGSKPADLYLNVWKELLAVNQKEGCPIRPDLLDTWTELGLGRKVAKKMIMVFQYSAGLPKQMQEFREVHESEDFPSHLRLNEAEVTALWKLWTKATSAVMSVDTVIKWFQERVKEIYANGKTEVLIPNATGAVQVMKYPLYELRRVKSFHNGQLTFREPTGEADLKAWKKAVLANATHMVDAALLSIALHDFDCSFSTVHDAAYCYGNSSMTQMLSRLKGGFKQAVEFNIWDEFRKINGLDHTDPTTAFPTTDTLDLDEVLDSDYLFA